ncbi:hypothetical protein M758_9G029900 [Ceratodon purpureus]|nr:hypothetical protein M758_9G029900 [Ceratodon purpureus]KAG0605083.1 hypothetical protein M758_9G029900 [Ceratodon purpureus]KAG0605084.1 hypothetical protein M758_9G029900 [Ceratodon purpureus]
MALAMAFLFLVVLGAGVHADTSFQYYQFSDSSGSISTLGDARIYIDDLALELTNTSAGRATYDYPVRVLSTSPSTSISFETTFIFSIEPDVGVPSSYGAGLTFSISSENTTVGDPGPFLGLVKANPSSSLALPTVKYFALEFDTHQDTQFQDMNDNHVGVDFNSLISNQAKPAQSGVTPITLASGSHIQAYVTYNSLAKILDVSIAPYVNQDYVKPAQSLISVPIDMGTLFNEYMYVGFSAATGAGSVKHKIWSWTFKTTTVDSSGQPVASPPDSVNSGPGPSPSAFDQGSGFGDSGSARSVSSILWPFLGLFAVMVGLVCS